MQAGTIEQNVYKNDAFEVTFHSKNGWVFALIPAGTVQFAPDLSTEDPVNRCSKALFSNAPTAAAKGTFGPKAIFFVVDPECFAGAPFPETTTDRTAVTAFARRVTHAFTNSPYVPPGGADYGGFDGGGRAFVTLTAEKTVSVPGAGPKSMTTHVNMLLMLMKSSGYWIVVAEAIDDESKRIMQAGQVDISMLR